MHVLICYNLFQGLGACGFTKEYFGTYYWGTGIRNGAEADFTVAISEEHITEKKGKYSF